MITPSEPEGTGFVLEYAGERIPFQIEFRRRKDLAISVLPNLRLEVVAPEGADQAAVLQRVKKRASWIFRQMRYFEQFQPARPQPSFQGGATHLYLGRQYRLKITEGSNESIRLIGKFFQVVTRPSSSPERVRHQLEDWYREHAKCLFAQRLQWFVESLTFLELDKTPKLVIRRMEKRWGSCTRAGNVLLNLDLVKAPSHCIDYVIVHELCHLKAHNHGPTFFHLLTRCMPDWKTRKERLDSLVM